MKRLQRWFKELGLLGLIVILNTLFVVQIVGAPYESFNWAAFAQIYSSGGETGQPAGCSDGLDNDADGLIDSFDPDCTVRAPVLGDGGLALGALMLLLLGGLALRRRRVQ